MYATLVEFANLLRGVVKIEDQKLQILDESDLRFRLVDDLVYTAVFNKNDEIVRAARWVIQETGR